MTETGHPSPSRAAWRKPVTLIALLAAALLLAHLLGIRERLGELRGWIASLGNWGPVAFVLIHAAAVVAALPGSLLTLAGGALFGVLDGVLLVSLASTLGASLAFLLARYFARDAVLNWLGNNDHFRKLDQLVARRGAVVVALTRLVPLFPFNVLNYGFGLTAVPFRTYVFWSWLCMLPGTVIFVAGSDVLFSALSQQGTPWIAVLLIALVGALLAVLTPFVRRLLSVTPNADKPSRKDRA